MTWQLGILLVVTVGILAVGLYLLWCGLDHEGPSELEQLPRLVLPILASGANMAKPVQLSKFRAERAELPKVGPPCESCRGVNLVWTLYEGKWQGSCRRCGQPFARVEREGWERATPREA